MSGWIADTDINFLNFIHVISLIGRVHSAMISGINKELNSVMVEWYENGEAKGKEVFFLCQVYKVRNIKLWLS